MRGLESWRGCLADDRVPHYAIRGRFRERKCGTKYHAQRELLDNVTGRWKEEITIISALLGAPGPYAGQNLLQVSRRDFLVSRMA